MKLETEHILKRAYLMELMQRIASKPKLGNTKINKLTLVIIFLAFAGSFLGGIHRFGFSNGWENIYPKWRHINKGIQALNPAKELPEKFLGLDQEGFNEILGIIEKHFIALPAKEIIRGITYRSDAYGSPEGKAILINNVIHLDLGGHGYLRVGSDKVLFEKIKNERSMLFFQFSMWLLTISFGLRLFQLYFIERTKEFRNRTTSNGKTAEITVPFVSHREG